jgi:hypothetical protein
MNEKERAEEIIKMCLVGVFILIIFIFAQAYTI